MSDETDQKLKGFVEYLSLISDMLSRMKHISNTYGINPTKMKEDKIMDDILAKTDPMIVGLLIQTMVKFRNVLDKPMENLDTLDSETIDQFRMMVNELKEKMEREQ